MGRLYVDFRRERLTLLADRWDGLGIGLLSMVGTITLFVTTERMTYGHWLFPRPWDHHKYIEIASSPLGSFQIAPYCWRIGKPVVASALPGSVQDGFITVSLLSVWAIGVFVYLIARRLEFSRSLALAAVLFYFALEWGPKLFVFSFWLPDSAASLVMVTAMWAVLARRDCLFALLLIVGVLVKESVLFVAPLAYALRVTQLIDWSRAARVALLVAPAVVTLVAVRMLIPAGNADPAYVASLPESLWLVHDGSPEYGYAESFRDFGLPRFADPRPDDLLSYTLRPFTVPLTALASLGAWRNRTLFLRLLPLLVLVYSQLLVAGDVERLLVAAFPAVLLLGASGAHWLADRLAVPHWAICVLPVALIAVELLYDVWFFVPLVLQLMVTVAFVVALLARRVASHRWVPLRSGA